MRISTRAVSMRSVVLAALLTLATSLSAQGRGRIVGHIYDAATGTPLAGAQVSVVEQPTSAGIASLDGRYTLLNVPAGVVSLRVRMIGYQAKVVSGLAGRLYAALPPSLPAEGERFRQAGIKTLSLPFDLRELRGAMAELGG